MSEGRAEQGVWAFWSSLGGGRDLRRVLISKPVCIVLRCIHDLWDLSTHPVAGAERAATWTGGESERAEKGRSRCSSSVQMYLRPSTLQLDSLPSQVCVASMRSALALARLGAGDGAGFAGLLPFGTDAASSLSCLRLPDLVSASTPRTARRTPPAPPPSSPSPNIEAAPSRSLSPVFTRSSAPHQQE